MKLFSRMATPRFIPTSNSFPHLTRIFTLGTVSPFDLQIQMVFQWVKKKILILTYFPLILSVFWIITILEGDISLCF